MKYYSKSLWSNNLYEIKIKRNWKGWIVYFNSRQVSQPLRSKRKAIRWAQDFWKQS